jgi:peptidoglycan/LPS O-acetylase OafA/YrhL
MAAAGDAHRLVGDFYSSALGLTNWHLIQDHSSYFGGLGRPSFVRHLWSLSVEIQFYVLCPFLVSWVARRRPRTAMAWLGAGVAASAATMALLYDAADPSRAYYGTDARIGALLSGALLAVALRDSSLFAEWPARARNLAGATAVLLLLGLFGAGSETARLMYPAGFLLTQAATATLIAVVHHAGAVGRGLALRPLRWLGERSYGTYLWHWPLVVLLRPRVDVDWSAGVAAVVTIGGAVVLGHLSYTYFERPFLDPLPRLGRVLGRIEYVLTAVAALGIALLVSDLPRADPILASLRAGQAVVSQQVPIATTSTSVAAATPVVVAPVSQVVSAVRPAPLPPAVGPPPGTVTVTAIGDSVMLGAAPQLQQRLGATGYIDAELGRQFGQGVDDARKLRAEGRLGEVVIVHLGTNGPPRTSQIDALMAALEDVPHVLLVTVRMPRSWEGSTNDALRAAAARYPRVAIVDWHGLSDGHPDWFESDGIHLRQRGAQAYANQLGGALPAPEPPPPPPTTTTSTEPPTTTTTSPGAPISVPAG